MSEAQPSLKKKDIVCLGHLQRVFPLLDRLHEVGCERDTAGNRELFSNDYLQVRSAVRLEPGHRLDPQTPGGIGPGHGGQESGDQTILPGQLLRSPAGLRPRLKPIIKELAAELPGVQGGKDPRLAELKDAMTLVDGTVVAALTRLAKAAVGEEARYTTARDGKPFYAWRLHTQLDLESFNPRRMDRTGARNAGDNREANVLRANLQPDRCYVGDGGYADRSLFNDIVKAQSSYVIRLAEDAKFEVVEERLLSQAALDDNVVRDAVVKLPMADGKEMTHPVRLLAVQVTPRLRRTRSGKKQSDLILIVTNLVDLPAELVALIYLYRYTVELFFRIFKQLLGMRHLLSQREEGIDIQVQCTLIVCLLICLMTGKRPNKSNHPHYAARPGWRFLR